MTVVTNRPGPAPSEIARIARRMGGTRNEVNETESTLISNAPAATGKLGETVASDPAITDPNLAHAKALAAKDPNGPLPTHGKPAVAHKKVATSTLVNATAPATQPTTGSAHTPPVHPQRLETAPNFQQVHDNTKPGAAPSSDLLK